MVRTIVLTALVAAVASGLQLGNPAAGSYMVRRTAAGGAAIAAVVATNAPESESTSSEGDGEDADFQETGIPQGRPNETGGRQVQAEQTGARQAQSAQTGLARGGDGQSFADDDDAGQTSFADDSAPTKTGLSGNNSPIETGFPDDGSGADQTGFPEDGFSGQTGNPPGVAAPTGGTGARNTDTPVLISEGLARPVGRVTVLLGLGAVALAIGLS
ncbi:hypothetical protein HRG_008356 [Hirsutella rhossiliensis]|uniref:Uncharacterized protein n=1 Tax=Hirsutella rhossiliensis TaxID=111463 RepID=A0A9P8SGQ7_9HYPO|nr:uncharacterized protein HRG_08356 [Hirsutella rhossiliensis]KAH0960201.1 hypothetical protein HRG_08356 [Hirsutella rhossiliensis]